MYTTEKRKADLFRSAPFEIELLRIAYSLERLNVLSLPALRSLYDVELNRLPFLKAAESVRLDGGEMDKYVLAILAADKTKTLSVVEPLYSSLFHSVANASFCVDLCYESEPEGLLQELAW